MWVGSVAPGASARFPPFVSWAGGGWGVPGATGSGGPPPCPPCLVPGKRAGGTAADGGPPQVFDRGGESEGLDPFGGDE